VLREAGTTTIYVTHDQTEAMGLADRIAVMYGGKIDQIGTPLEVYATPATRFVGGFLGNPPMNFIKVALRRRRRAVGERPRLPARTDGESSSGFAARTRLPHGSGVPFESPWSSDGLALLLTDHRRPARPHRSPRRPPVAPASGWLSVDPSRLTWIDSATGARLRGSERGRTFDARPGATAKAVLARNDRGGYNVADRPL
jgi:multiple sugar transport system ATP-binding protein